MPRPTAPHDERRSARALCLLGALNDALDGVTDEVVLLQKICDVVVEVGGHDMAWIGVAEDDERRTVRPAAYAGRDDGYPANVNVVWSDTELGRGPIGTAIRTMRPVLVRTSNDASSAPWPEAALARGFAVCFAVPLMLRGRAAGAIVLFTGDPHAFEDPAEAALLTELGRSAGREWALLAADRARREAEARFAELAEHMRDYFWSVDLRSRKHEYVSPAFTTITGFSRAILREGPQSFLVVVHPDDRPRVAGALAQDMAGTEQEIEFRLIRSDGEVRWARTRSFVQRDEAGVAVRLLGITADVTEQHLAAEALRRDQERFRWMVENGWDAVALADRTGVVLYANQVWERVLGWSPSEIVGTRGESFISSIPEAIATRVASDALAQPGVPIRLEMPIQHRDGHLLWFDVTVLNLLDDPLVGAVVWTGHDITERHEHAAALHELNFDLERRVAERTAELTDLYDHAPCGYFTVGVQGIIVRINATMLRWLGRDHDEVVGERHVDELLSPSFGGMLTRDFPADGDAVSNLEAQFLREDGSILHALLNATARRGVDGRLIGVRAMVFDHSERHAIEQRIREANAALARAMQAKDNFLASMSHELRTPLNGVLGLAEALREQVYGPINERQEAALGRLDGSGRHLLSLINDILDLAKIEAGKVGLDLTPVDVAELCRRSLELVHVSARKKGILVSYVGPVSTSPVLADERRMKQVLVNLLGNAVKFTPAGGQIGLSGSTSADTVRFEVWDTGVGVAAEDIPRLFRPFEQLDSRLSREHAGTGLGLSLVRQFVELHHGSVEVESTPGVGSCFTVTIPLVLPPSG